MADLNSHTPASRIVRTGELVLAGRMVVWILALPLLKRVISLRRLAALMYLPPQNDRVRLDEARLCQIAGGLTRRLLFMRRGVCLEQSLVAYRFLSANGSSPELIIGVGRNSGRVIAHAWVVLNGQPLWDTPATLSEFVPVVAFGPQGMTATHPGHSAL